MSKLKPTFVSVAETLIRDAETDVKSGSRPSSVVRDYRQRLNCYCKPYFKAMALEHVSFRTLKDFQAWLVDAREISPNTIRAIMSFVSVVLKLALDEGMISQIPRIPRPPQKDAPRPSFTVAQYRTLLKQMKLLEKASPPILVRAWQIDWELRAFTTFMVNSFLRPGDMLALRHRNVEIKATEDGTPYLKLTPPTSKTVDYPVVTMPFAVPVYQRICKVHGASGHAAPNDFLFHPTRQSRLFAMEIVRRQFLYAIDEAGLSNANEDVWTLYSLRHTAIMFRLLNSRGLDLLTLARACRTSVEMIDRFYARRLHAEMNIDLIHSQRRTSRLLSDLIVAPARRKS